MVPALFLNILVHIEKWGKFFLNLPHLSVA